VPAGSPTPPALSASRQWIRLPSRLPYSPLLRDWAGADSVSDDEGRIPDAERLAGRLDVRLDVRRTDARGRGVLARGLEIAEPDLRDDERLVEPGRDSDIAMSPDLAGAERAAVLELDLDADLERAVDRRTGERRTGERRTGDAATGFADCMVLAAVMSAFAAVVIALVAVFIDCIADDIVRADAVAFVAAMVILLAAEVTLVAAEETPLAAVAGVVALRLDALLRVVVLRLVPPRLAVLRLPLLRLAVLRRVPVERDAVERDAAEREAVDRDAVLRVDRDAVLRGVLAAVPRADFAALLRLADDEAEDVPEPGVDFDRLAVPRDALRLTGLLRAELAELRRVAARVVDDTGTEIPPS
jgi:hypothetical protein